MGTSIQPADLGFLVALSGSGSMSATARDLGISKAAVSKRLAAIEGRTGVSLVNRTTRRMSLTPEGEAVVERARRILGDIEDIDRMLSRSGQVPRGLLRVNATLGFGRSHVAPLISHFVQRHPEVQVQLQLSVNPPPLTEDQFDVCIRFGEPPDARVSSRKRLAANRRVLCAAPAYLQRHGQPRTPQDLATHNCIGIRQGDEAYGTWKLSSGKGPRRRTEAVKTQGNLATNDGEIAVRWALDGHGIVMRAEWDVARHLRDGRLVLVLPQWDTPEADIHAIYPQRLQLSSRVRSVRGLHGGIAGAGARRPGLNPDGPCLALQARSAQRGLRRAAPLGRGGRPVCWVSTVAALWPGRCGCLPCRPAVHPPAPSAGSWAPGASCRCRSDRRGPWPASASRSKRPAGTVVVTQEGLVQPAALLAAHHVHPLVQLGLGRVTAQALQRVAAAVVHRRGAGHGAGVEGLHLVGAEAVALEPERQVQHVFVTGARVRGDEVRDQELLLAGLGAELVEQLLEAVVAADAGLHHLGQRTGLGVLGRDLQITADMVGHQLLHIGR